MPRRTGYKRPGLAEVEVEREPVPARVQVVRALGPAGVLTGGADVLWVVGSATITTLFNRA